MASITYEIDPDGDIDLVLKDPNTQDIVPLIKEPEVINDGDDTFDNPPLVGRYEIFNIAKEACDDEASEDKAVDDKTGVDEAGVDETGVSNAGSNKVSDIAEVRMRVSSRHLILASRTFRKMLEGGWSESSSKALQSGRRQIETSGWNAAALAIVLDTIHGRHRDIPKYTNLGLLTRIATIIDYYQCHESLELIVEIWMTSLCDKFIVPTTICRSSLLWLYISWVFSERKITSDLTKILLEDSDGLSNIDLSDLPLAGVIDIIETKRQELISKIINSINKLRKELSEEEGCPGSKDPNCSAIMLGILIREQHKLKLLDPQLAAPFNGYSILDLKKRIRKFPKSRPEQKSITKSPEPKPETRSSLYYDYDRPLKKVSTENSKDKKPCSCNISCRLQFVLEGIESDLASFEVTTEQDPRK